MFAVMADNGRTATSQSPFGPGLPACTRSPGSYDLPIRYEHRGSTDD